ncbi:MAG TPA: glycosyltransferase family 4 protein [Candidatus Saccharimonadales bacterium]|nr:glycosyltransferase family 4 protein [Candidatus Saccharimonadales bacterium]
MKLLISLSYYSPYISGLTLSIKRLAELLLASGYKVTILTSRYDKKLPRREDINQVSIVRVPYLLRISKGFVMPRFIDIAYRELHNTDCVLIVLPQVEGWILAFLAKMLGRKVICIYICEVTLSGGIGAKLIESVLRLCNRMALSFADEVTTLSDDFAKHNALLKELPVYGIYPVVIPPVITTDEKNKLLKRLPQKKYYIGFLGRIAHEKGISYLLETVPLLQKSLGDDFVIVLAGPKKTVGEEKYRREIEDLLQKYPEFVIQLGEFSDEQLGAFYSLLDVFVLPSINNTEAFGMVQVEAMYCGTPVVATNLPGVRVPIKETGMGEIVPIRDSKALADAIGTVLHNKKKYVQSKEKIHTIFSEEKIVNEYKEFLRV